MTIVIVAAILLAIWLFLWSFTEPRDRRRSTSFEPVPDSGWYHQPDSSPATSGGWSKSDDDSHD